MNKSRLEAFSDGVLAIIITIMVLEIKVPHGSEWIELKPLIPRFISYLMSFFFIGIFWGSHHHLTNSVKEISSGIMWANLNVLFWLSMIPFATGWMGENYFASNTIAAYGVSLLMSAIALDVLRTSVQSHIHDSNAIQKAFFTRKKKGRASMIGYLLAIPFAYIAPIVSQIIFFAIAIAWLIPDRNFERALKGENKAS